MRGKIGIKKNVWGIKTLKIGASSYSEHTHSLSLSLSLFFLVFVSCFGGGLLSL